MIPNVNTKPAGSEQGACVAHGKVLWSKRTGAIPDKGFQEEEGGLTGNAIGCSDTSQADRLLRAAGMQNF